VRIVTVIVVGLFILLLFGGQILPLLGRLFGGQARKPFRQAKWVWASLGGNEEEVRQAEEEFGAECAREFAAPFRGTVDDQAQALVTAIGDQLEKSALSGRRFRCQAVSAPTPNAFALPGGYIFVTDSLVDLCERRQDEIALLLAHEMAHVALGHSRQKLMVDQVLNVVTARAAGAGMLARRLLSEGYSREQETEADGAGLRLAVRAGFDGALGIEVLRRLKRQAPPAPPIGEFFASHPPLAERIQALESELRPA